MGLSWQKTVEMCLLGGLWWLWFKWCAPGSVGVLVCSGVFMLTYLMMGMPWRLAMPTSLIGGLWWSVWPIVALVFSGVVLVGVVFFVHKYCIPVRSSEYFSSRIQSIIESRSKGEHETTTDAEIEASKATWSELREAESNRERCIEGDKAFFRSLQEKYVGSDGWKFFCNWSELEWELGEKIAEGGQGAIHALKGDSRIVVKVIKLGGELSMEALHNQMPPGMLKVIQNARQARFVAGRLSPIYRGVMFEDGMFGFVMWRHSGDLRMLIDAEMIHNGNQASPFAGLGALFLMREIAKGMMELHENGIVHGDLKAANVLILPSTGDRGKFRNLVSSMLGDLFIRLRWPTIADFECSAAVVGTEFWRAPEILIALRNRCFEPNLRTEKSDVYSFGMTCYEILTGKIPFEGERPNDYDIVLGGKRPEFPSGISPWFQNILYRCWHHEPCERPSFEELVDHLGLGDYILAHLFGDSNVSLRECRFEHNVFYDLDQMLKYCHDFLGKVVRRRVLNL